MDGKEVYRHAVLRMIATAQKALAKIGKKPDDLALLIPHQANIRIIESIATRMKIPMQKVFLNIHKYGNMSAGTGYYGERLKKDKPGDELRFRLRRRAAGEAEPARPTRKTVVASEKKPAKTAKTVEAKSEDKVTA